MKARPDAFILDYIINLHDIVFVFIGAGSEKAKLKIIAQEENLRNVRFLEPAPVEFISRLYSLAFAGLASLRDLPFFEGTRSCKIFPAMASGVPVLYCGRGEGARLVEEAEAGMVIPPDNPEALAEGIRQLVVKPRKGPAIGPEWPQICGTTP